MAHSREAAQAILDAYMEDLGGIFPAAWDQWEELGEAAPEIRMHLCKRSRASVVSNLAAAKASATFSDKAPSVVIQDRPGFLLLEIDSQLCLRLNKFRSGTRQMGGIPTQQRIHFGAQEPITGMPLATNLVLGYDLNADETGILASAITCSTHGRLHWEIALPSPGEAVVVEPQRPSTGPQEPGLTSLRSREGGGEQRGQ